MDPHPPTPVSLARSIEHTLLRPETTVEQIDRLCDETCRFGFFGVCVNPIHVRRTASRLAEQNKTSTRDTLIRTVTVVGFPLGANLPSIKADEARRAIDDGADEVDMVVALGALIAGDHAAVRKDINAVARALRTAGAGMVLKVILETAVLTTDQIVLGCRCAMEGEADFVKTSTGFHPAGGATVEHVRLLHRYASPLGVKAAGGIRTLESARAMLDAGANRIGTSAGVAMIGELLGNQR